MYGRQREISQKGHDRVVLWIGVGYLLYCVQVGFLPDKWKVSDFWVIYNTSQNRSFVFSRFHRGPLWYVLCHGWYLCPRCGETTRSREFDSGDGFWLLSEELERVSSSWKGLCDFLALSCSVFLPGAVSEDSQVLWVCYCLFGSLCVSALSISK